MKIKSLLCLTLAMLFWLPSALAVVLINEVDSDTPGTDALEFVELYSTDATTTSLDGLVLVFYNGNGDTSYLALDLDGYSTNASGFFTVGNAGVAGVSIVITNNFIQNGQDAVALYAGDATSFPNGTAVTTANLIDAVVYDTNDADDAGLLVLLNSGEPQINESANLLPENDSIQRCPDGAGGARNTSSFVVMAPSAHASNNACLPTATPTTSGPTNTPVPTDTPAPPTNTPSGSASILINEVDADTFDTDTMEFVELYDGGVGNTSLNGLALVFYNGSGDTSYYAVDLDGHTTNSSGFFTIGNALVPGVSMTFANNLLQNGADAVALYAADATSFPTGTAVTTTNLIDAVVYDTSDLDDTGLLVLLNSGQPQIDENANLNSANESIQRCPDGAGGARNTSSFMVMAPSANGSNCVSTPTPTPTTGGPTNTPVSTNTPTETPTYPPIPDVVINEFFYDDDSTDESSFVELKGPAGLSLDGFTVQPVNQLCAETEVPVSLSGYTIPDDGYFVIGMTGVINVDLVHDEFVTTLQNGPCDGVWLLFYGQRADGVRCGTDCATTYPDSCGEGVSEPEPLIDHSVSRVPDGSDTDDNFTDFCDTEVSPGEANADCYIPPTTPPTEPPTATPTGPTPVPTETPTPGPATSTPTVTVPTATPTFCANNIVMNGDFESWELNGAGGPPDGWTNLTADFTASQESVIVLDGMYSCNLTWTSTTTQTITQVIPVMENAAYDIRFHAYDNDPAGRIRLYGYWKDSLGVQVDAAVETAYTVDMDGWQTLEIIAGSNIAPAGAVTFDYQIRMYDVSGSWLGTATVYVDVVELCGESGPTPTPTMPPTATPTAMSVTIYDIQYTEDPTGDSPYVGMNVVTHGVITAFQRSNREMYIQDGAGHWNGVKVYLPEQIPTLEIGDIIEVEGSIMEYYGMTEINPVSRIMVTGSGVVPTPEIVPTGEMAQEHWEGVLIRAQAITVTNINPDDPDDFGEWQINDGTGTIRVDDCYYSYDPILNEILAFVQGTLNYSFSNFKLEPRDYLDIDGAPTPTPSPSPTATSTPTPPPSPTQPPVIPASGPIGIGILLVALSVLIGLVPFRKS